MTVFPASFWRVAAPQNSQKPEGVKENIAEFTTLASPAESDGKANLPIPSQIVAHPQNQYPKPHNRSMMVYSILMHDRIQSIIYDPASPTVLGIVRAFLIKPGCFLRSCQHWLAVNYRPFLGVWVS